MIANRFQYRADIDGLRAIAVLSVILFHINKALLPGGFVGVDIFFVISGFLISLHILQELDNGIFSVVEFYRRRVKRIAPAMLLVVFFTLSFASFAMVPVDAMRVSDSALWSIFSFANIYFWKHLETGYFAASSSEVPLLHLWSLGVEEQFYLLWPLLLAFAHKRAWINPFLRLSVVIAAFSYIAAELFFETHASFVYYMLPTRAGELLVGAVVAFGVARGKGNGISSRWATILAAGGLVLIGISLLLIKEDQVFPGFLAVPPTAGAALLIFAGTWHRNGISRLLSVKPLVWVGLVSYSAYLWHWPLLAFYRYGYGEVDFAAGFGIFALTFLLAWLTYEFVEKPTRRSSAPAHEVFIRQFVVPSAVLASVALAMIHLGGYGFRQSQSYKSQLAELRDQTLPAVGFDYVCQRNRVSERDLHDERCVAGKSAAEGPRVILWGDSNAAHYIGVISTIAFEAGFQYRNIEVSACPPVFGDPGPFVSAKRLADCVDSAVPIRSAIEGADVVIVAASWSDYHQRSAGFLDQAFSTINALADAGKLVILIGKAPVFPDYDRRCREKSLSFPFLECVEGGVPLSQDVADINARLKTYAAAMQNVQYFDVSPYLCSSGDCSPIDAHGRPLYYDRGHLSLAGSWQLGESIIRQSGVPPPFGKIAHWKGVLKQAAAN